MERVNYLLTNNIKHEMKPYSIFKILVITLIGLPVLLKAQISERFTLTQNEIVFQKNAEFDELTTKDYSFTEEIGNPQLPTRIESFVVPFDAIVSGLQITSVTKQNTRESFIFTLLSLRDLLMAVIHLHLLSQIRLFIIHPHLIREKQLK